MSEKLDHIILERVLKRLIRKEPLLSSMIGHFANGNGVDICIKNHQGEVVYGEDADYQHCFQLMEDEILYGTLYSNDAKSALVADLIKLLTKKEIDKKRIGSEVLGLYREINMIYNFSEIISQKIDDVSIAESALQEASQIIQATHGLFLLFDPAHNKVSELASMGHNPNKNRQIDQQNLLLRELIRKGTSTIVPPAKIKANPAIAHLKAVMYAPLRVKQRTLGLVILGHQNEKEFTAAELKLLTTIALQSAAAIESAQLYQKGLKEARDREEAIMTIHKASQKFIPFEFINSLGKNKLTEVALGDQVEREVTVLFTDIRGFTGISENMTPKENFFFINSFNKRMGPIVRKNEGFIMQYLGDGFMALFPKGSQYALRASVEMHAALKEYNAERLQKKRSPVKIGVGMQNGKLIMGITGDVERMDAAIISDTVNTAARIEGLSKYYGTSILLTDLCMDSLTNPGEFDFRYLGPVRVQGKQKPIDLYECINGDSEDLYKHKLRSKKTFEQGMDLYFNKEFAMAAVTFQKLIKQNPDDHTARLFLNRSAHLITQEIGDDWKGIEAMDKK